MSTVTLEIRFARASDAGGIAKVHDEAWRGAYRGIIPGADLERMVSKRGPAWWQSAIRRGNRIAVMCLGDQIGGYVNYGRNRAKALAYGGEIYELYLAPEFQGLGFGRRLFNAARKDLASHSLSGTVVWALSDNEGAVSFYSALGGRAVARSCETFGTRNLDKTAFGWKG